MMHKQAASAEYKLSSPTYLVQVSTHDHQPLDALHQLSTAAPQANQQAVVALNLTSEEIQTGRRNRGSMSAPVHISCKFALQSMRRPASTPVLARCLRLKACAQHALNAAPHI